MISMKWHLNNVWACGVRFTNKVEIHQEGCHHNMTHTMDSDQLSSCYARLGAASPILQAFFSLTSGSDCC